MKNELVEGVDFRWEDVGGVKCRVFTEAYHLERCFCCGNNCRNCAYKKDNGSNHGK